MAIRPSLDSFSLPLRGFTYNCLNGRMDLIYVYLCMDSYTPARWLYLQQLCQFVCALLLFRTFVTEKDVFSYVLVFMGRSSECVY